MLLQIVSLVFFSSIVTTAVALLPSSNAPHSERIVWLVRHGHREDMADNQWRAKGALPWGQRDDPPLSTFGHQQVYELGRKMALSAEPIDYVISSPFTRCLQTTAEIVRQLPYQPQVFVEPGFAESTKNTKHPPGYPNISAGAAYCHLSVFENYEPCYTREFLPSFAEKLTDIIKRVDKTLYEHILRRYPSGNILIVSHAEPVLAARALLGGFARVQPYPGLASISKHVLDSTGQWTQVF